MAIYRDVPVTWSYIDQTTGRETAPADFTGLVYEFIQAKYNAKGKLAAADNTDFTHLVVTFKSDYKDASGNPVPLTTQYGSTFTAQIRINDAKTGEDHIVYVPFTIAEPAAAEYTSLYKFDPAYYADGTLTVLDVAVGGSVDLANYITDATGSGSLRLDWNNAKSSAKLITISGSTLTRKAPVEETTVPDITTVSGWRIQYMGRYFDLPSFKVKFVTSQLYTMVTDSASVSIMSGESVERAKLYYRDVTDDPTVSVDKPNYFYVKDVESGEYYDISTAISEGSVKFEFYSGVTNDGVAIPISNNNYIEIGAYDAGSFAITAKKKLTVDTQVPVTVLFEKKMEVTPGNYEYVPMCAGKFTVTVKAYPVE